MTAPAPASASAADPLPTLADPAEIADTDAVAAIDIDVELAPTTQPEPAAPPPPPASARGPFASAPSAGDLLERAAALGPVRLTWESIVLPTDPILDEKRTPYVAERRARLTRLVKGALGACVAVCVIALGVSALSSSTSDKDAKTSASAAKSVPSKGVVPIESISSTKLGKASPMTVARAPVFTPPPAQPARGKRR